MGTKLVTIDGKLYVSSTYQAEDKLVLKAWESYSGWYWFATELNANGNHFGLVQGFEDELGYFSQEELESLSPRVWPIKDCDLAIAGRR